MNYGITGVCGWSLWSKRVVVVQRPLVQTGGPPVHEARCRSGRHRVGDMADTHRVGDLSDTHRVGHLADTHRVGHLADTHMVGRLADTHRVGHLADTMSVWSYGQRGEEIPG